MVKHVIIWDFKDELTAEQKKEAAARMKEGLEALNGVVPEGDNICELVCQRVKASVDAFAAGAPQADDITMLCLYYRQNAKVDCNSRQNTITQ